MNSKSVQHQPNSSDAPQIGVFDCEVHLKFRLIEEKIALGGDREQLLETLIDALSCGADDYLEYVQVKVDAQELPEVEASPKMRRQLIRLRNSRD